jgi:hypothetical protein
VPVLAFVVLCAVLSATPAGAQVVIPAGAEINLGTGQLAGGCLDVDIAGTLRLSQGSSTGVRSLSVEPAGVLDGGTGSFAWSGDWSNSGQFMARSSRAASLDGCGRSTSTFMSADHFDSLSLQSADGREIRFPAGQSTTVGHSFTAHGIAALPLRIRSTVAGRASIIALDPATTQDIFAVDVADNHAFPSPIAPGAPASYQSIKGPNSEGWFSLANVPAVSTAGLAIMIAMLACVALLRMKDAREERKEAE